MSNKKILTVELVPKTCQWSSVRACLPKKDWDIIRQISYKQANNTCEICGSNGLKQGFKHKVECHEIWEYNQDTKTQILTGLISLCPICHMTKHIGRSIAIGKEIKCFKQLNKVNKWTQKEIDDHIQEAFKNHKILSKIKWDLDISILSKEPYNIDLSNFKGRIFENKIPSKKNKKKKTNTKQKTHPLKKISDVLNKTKKNTNKRPPKNK